MSLPDWDVDSYKTEHESDEHWELRRNFMLAHKDKLTEDESVCMAQVFTNIEFMGCRYPTETMIRVAELAKGVVETYREKRKDSLKRTFVAASDAASAKVKGLRGGGGGMGNEKFPRKHQKPMNFVSASNDDDCEIIIEKEIPPSTNTNLYPNPYNSSFTSLRTDAYSNNLFKSSNTTSMLLKPPGIYNKFVLLLNPTTEHPVSTIERNANLNKVFLRWEALPIINNERSCKVFINEELVAVGIASTERQAKEQCAILAIEELRKNCNIIQIKPQVVTTSVDPSSFRPHKAPSKKGRLHLEDKPLSEDNKGLKLMKQMGWEGGGLGSRQQGRAEPIPTTIRVRREGLGHGLSDNRSFKDRARAYILEWLNSASELNLIFPSEFTNAERKAMHQIAAALDLKSKSYGKGNERYLVISKKATPWQIAEKLATMGGSSEMYEMLPS